MNFAAISVVTDLAVGSAAPRAARFLFFVWLAAFIGLAGILALAPVPEGTSDPHLVSAVATLALALALGWVLAPVTRRISGGRRLWS